MNRKIVCYIFFLSSFLLPAQTIDWKVGLDYFFDNTEYARSTLAKSQTLTGVHLAPELGLTWGNHHIFAGFDALKTAGSKKIIDKIEAIAYYQFSNATTNFYAGAFKRKELLKDYSVFFITDSIHFYRPVMHGIYFRKGTDDAYYKLWLDWTGFQTPTEHESFYIGASAHKKFNIFFGNFQAYLFHYANTRPGTSGFNVSEQFLSQLSVGVDMSKKTIFDKFIFSMGMMAGIERIRNFSNWLYLPEILDWVPITIFGAVVETDMVYKRFRMRNNLYAGQKRLRFYDYYGNNFYWNTVFLQSNFYLRSDWSYELIKHKFVNASIGINLHFSEKKLMFEQMFLLTVDINKE